MPNKTLEGEIRYYTDGEQATADTLNRPVEDVAKTGQYMSEAQFMKNAEVNRSIYAGSGVIQKATVTNTNPGFFDALNTLTSADTVSGNPNTFGLNVQDWTNDTDKKDLLFNVNGNIIKWYGTTVNTHGYKNIISLPEAPMATVETNCNTSSKSYKQGEFIYLNDTTSDITNRSKYSIHSRINGYTYTEGSNTVTIDNNVTSNPVEGYVQIIFDNLIHGAKYKLSVQSNKVSTTSMEGYSTYLGSTLDKGQVFIYGDSSSDINTDLQQVDFIANGSSAKVTFYNGLDGELTYTFKLEALNEAKLVCIKDIETNEVFTSATNVQVVDSISRQDLVFLETWHELIQEKDIVYPYGNIQYSGGNTDGLSGIAEGIFSGADTYSLFGNWQSAGDLIGKGYVWSSLSQEDKLKFASNKDNNIYMSKDGLVQVRYRVRVIKGLVNKDIMKIEFFDPNTGASALNYFGSNSYLQFKGKLNNTSDIRGGDNGLLIYTGSNNKLKNYLGTSGNNNSNLTYLDYCQALPIALVQRRNQGAFDPVHNPEGSSVFSDGKMWYETSASHNNIIDCFNNAGTGDIASGVSGRPDDLYYDEINERDVEDLRMSAHKIHDKKGYLEEQFNKAVRGEIRGKEKYSTKVVNNSILTYITKTSITYFGLPDTDGLIEKYRNISFRGKSGTWYKSTYIGIGQDGTQGDGTKINRIHVNYIKNGYELSSTNSDFRDDLPSAGEELYYYIEVNSDINYIQNNTALVCDIIGDPRTLNRRVKYTTTGSTQSVDIASNDYVLDGTTYYRFIGTPGTLDLNIEDFTNVSNWVSLGTDGTIGGYPQEWKDHGIFGTPLLVGENGESLLPADIIVSNGFRKFFNLSKKSKGIKKVIRWNGSDYKEFTIDQSGGYASELDSYANSGNTALLNWDEGNRNNDEVFLVFYETDSDTTELTSNMIVEAIGSVSSINYSGYHLTDKLLNKVPTTTVHHSDSVELSAKTVWVDNKLTDSTNLGHKLDHPSLEIGNTSVAAKMLPYLTKVNSRAQMNIVFKEIKWDTGIDDPTDFENIPSTTSNGDLIKNNKYHITDGKLIGYYISIWPTFTGSTFEDSTNYWFKDDEGNIRDSVYNHIILKRWDGNGWGDDSQFQIINNVSTMQDDNDQTVLYGQKSIKLPNFLD